MSHIVTRHRALRYMTEFRCIADRCADPCCSGLEIAVDRSSYERLEAATARDAGGPERFRRLMVIKEGGLSAADHARMRRREDGSCVALTADRLCSIHREYGESLLSDTCATYPRVVSQVGGRIEIAGALSCPEAARLCLTREDAVDAIDVDPAILPRAYVGKVVVPESAPPYERHLDDIREVALDIIRDRRFPLSSRFAFVVHFPDRLNPFFRREPLDVEGAAAAITGRLADEIAFIRTEAQRSALSDWLRRKAIVPGPVASMLFGILQALLRDGTKGRLAVLLDRVLSVYGSGASETLVHAYEARSRRLCTFHGEMVDRYLINYSANVWSWEWYTRRPTLASYVLGWLIRVGLLRILLAGHPGSTAVMDAPAASAASREALDKVAVEVFQTFVKEVEHRQDIRDAIEGLVFREGDDLFGRSLLFAVV